MEFYEQLLGLKDCVCALPYKSTNFLEVSKVHPQLQANIHDVSVSMSYLDRFYTRQISTTYLERLEAANGENVCFSFM